MVTVPVSSVMSSARRSASALHETASELILNLVVNQQLDRTFAALADPTRRALVTALISGERSVSDLAAPLPMSLVAVSKHLAVLERAGLVIRRKKGRIRFCALRPAALSEAADWVDWHRRFWTERLDSLHHHLAAEGN
jgi:DNA-binding transcriptional ArsR family regulator